MLSLVSDLFLFCNEWDFMKSLTKEKRYDIIDAFNSTSKYPDDLLNMKSIQFELMVHRFTEYINFNLIKLMLLIPNQPF